MAGPANEVTAASCSPIPSRQNPSPRNSETSNLMRRSFSGNPFAKPSILPNSRGFNYNPVTPANSPSDFYRRNSTGRENKVSPPVWEDKENGKDQNQKPARVRSPAAPPPKGTKNFMSPTISAASKMNASPRKKVLSERNEKPRSSVSFSDVVTIITEDNEPKPKTGLDQKILQASHENDVVESPFVSKNNEKDSSLESGGHEADPSFKISPGPSVCYSFPDVAPLDADPLLPAYCPKTNYLSPRPQFLHYKPNPRMELYLAKEKEGKQLEEIFASESSSSDTEEDKPCDGVSLGVAPVMEDEVAMEQQEEKGALSSLSVVKESVAPVMEDEVATEQQQEKGAVSSLSVVKESVAPVMEDEVAMEQQEEKGDVSSLNMVKESVAPVMEDEVATEQQEEKGDVSSLSVVKESVQENRVPKSWISTALKLIACFSVLAIACFSVLAIACFSISTTGSLLAEPATSTDLRFSEFHLPPGITESAKSNLDQLGRKFKQWPANCYASIWKLILGLGAVQDLTDSLEEPSFGQYPPLDPGFLESFKEKEEPLTYQEIACLEEEREAVEEEYNEHDQLENEAQGDTEMDGNSESERMLQEREDIEEEYDGHGFEEQDQNENEARGNSESERVFQETVDEVTGPTTSGTDQSPERVEPAVVYTDTEPEPEPEPQPDGHTEEQGPRTNKNQISISDFGADQSPERVESDVFSLEHLEESRPQADDNHGSILDPDQPVLISGERQREDIIWISMLILGLVAAAATFLLERRKSLSPKSAAPVEQRVSSKKLDQSPTSASMERLSQERLSRMNWQAEVEAVLESCPPETSSSGSGSSYCCKKSLEGDEKKPRRNCRRESLASSSTEFSEGSPSYGSFTIYERIPFKTSHGEEEVVTPVRRSSRLRNQVASP